MATVRLQRRNRLASKLKEVFELEGIDEVCAEMPCWLLRSVLLQGYMYLTNSYLCFFAHMPSREDQVLKSGSLTKKAQRTKRWIKHWFVLKNDALSWYNSSSDPYFPHGIVDLRYAVSCEPFGEKEFRLRTNQKSVSLSADSVPSRDEWVKAVRKVIFKAQNMGDSVKIAIPYSAILDVEKSSAMDFSDTIEVKVVDKDDSFSIDSYFFAYFHDMPLALDQIRDAVRTYRSLPEPANPYSVMDTTAATRTPLPQSIERAVSAPAAELPSRAVSAFRLPSLFRTSQPPTPDRAGLPDTSDNEEFTHISRRPNSFIPITSSPKQMNSELDDSSKAATPTQSTIEHTYPPSTSFPSTAPDSPLHSANSGSSWGVGVPSWFKGKRVFGGSVPQVKEMYTPPQTTPNTTGSGSTGDMAFSVLETPELMLDTETTEKFRAAFAYDNKEMLLGYFPGFLFRLLPINGRLYVSTNFFCFKSSGPLATRTRMAIPIRDILATEKSKGTRFGHHGVVVIIKGHEELFFEFWGEEKRDAFMRLLERQMDDVRRRLATGESNVPSQGNRDALILEEFEPTTTDDSDTPAPDSSMTDSLPAVMFTSASSTFLTFKPSKSMHFTCLTIGSRGDVQPYIALAKGLMADGHRVRIATHVEFKDWIESHGIEYGYVGGDPAELMRICVENGMFTVAFLKEGLQKFRGWLDDLLKTSWEACQGTDVLIESPSAMGGLHIAEALKIPYYRAFTMTWSRTRAYPHAFAVPERKMGGGYNYMSYVMFDQVFWRAISGQINRWRRKMLNIEGTNLDKMEPHKVPFLYNFSPSVVPPPLDWPEWIRITGYWFLNDADASGKKWSPPDSLTKFIDSARKEHKKIVYIGFGSIVVSDPKAMTRCVIEAVVNSGVRAILSKGWSDRLAVKTTDASDIEEPLPPQIYPISSIPHDWLFQRIDAACHHGGAGTTGASLRAGIPTIIHPFFGDQFFWADRVEALGVGSGVRRLTVDSLTDALAAATTDEKQIYRAKTVGEKIRSEDGVATAIESIYRDLEYARSLIKASRSPDDSDEEMIPENSAIRDSSTTNSEHNSGYNSSGGGGAPSEDWSVISADGEERRTSSSISRPSVQRRRSSTDRMVKRNSLAAAVRSVLPESLTAASPRRAASPGY
ncbi:glycosyltransferase family 1 protein [Schizophyllum amplum]|uniref:Sterol 3-beta-glucosyltransferase n=1 Tax=Schizophyllum amplum TaxID=97359 RepID=A0A550C5Q1_9AGAR|nr:glycosyltransferase family 1 protein [Auriculariopsis ampla]